MKKIYIAGKVTGLQLVELTFKFGTAEKRLTQEGWIVANPLNIVIDRDLPWKQAMLLCIRELLDCNAIYMLHDWHDSKGAILEHNIAIAIGIQVIYSKPHIEQHGQRKDEPKWD